MYIYIYIHIYIVYLNARLYRKLGSRRFFEHHASNSLSSEESCNLQSQDAEGLSE